MILPSEPLDHVTIPLLATGNMSTKQIPRSHVTIEILSGVNREICLSSQQVEQEHRPSEKVHVPTSDLFATNTPCPIKCPKIKLSMG
jgi:hypothetical protein